MVTSEPPDIKSIIAGRCLLQKMKYLPHLIAACSEEKSSDMVVSTCIGSQYEQDPEIVFHATLASGGHRDCRL